MYMNKELTSISHELMAQIVGGLNTASQELLNDQAVMVKGDNNSGVIRNTQVRMDVVDQLATLAERTGSQSGFSFGFGGLL
jgi:hypothetical protein